MKRLWIALFFLVGVSFAAVWVADHPGQVTIRWFDYRIDTSFAFVVIVSVIAAWLMITLYTWGRDLAHAPKRFGERQQLKHYQKGLAELTYSVAALAASDNATAEKHLQKAQRLLGATPMGLLVSAQIAKSRGEEARARELLNEMMNHKETKQVATSLLTNASGAPKSTEYTWGGKLRSFVRKNDKR
jgi:HemY protein